MRLRHGDDLIWCEVCGAQIGGGVSGEALPKWNRRAPVLTKEQRAAIEMALLYVGDGRLITEKDEKYRAVLRSLLEENQP